MIYTLKPMFHTYYKYWIFRYLQYSSCCTGFATSNWLFAPSCQAHTYDWTQAINTIFDWLKCIQHCKPPETATCSCDWLRCLNPANRHQHPDVQLWLATLS